MSRSPRKLAHAAERRRYLVHLFHALETSDSTRHYVARIQPWTSCGRTQPERHERFFADEYALVEAVNPLLPCGSDVRDVLGYIESDDGFFYLLHLTSEEARSLGWNG